MALSQKHRTSLFTSLAPMLGEEEADALLSQFPSTDLDTPATKDFVRAEVVASKDELRAEIVASKDELRAEIVAAKDELRAEMAAMETRLRAEMVVMRDELRAEMAAMETRLRAEMVVMRDESRGMAASQAKMNDKLNAHMVWTVGLLLSLIVIMVTATGVILSRVG